MINTFKKISAITLIGTSLIFTGCTSGQQDSLFDSTLSFARDSVGFDVKKAQAGDVELTYMERTSDQKDAETLLLIHGFSANKDNWVLFTHSLDEKYHVIAVDLAGHGDSDKDITTSYDLVSQSQRLEALMTGLGIDAFHIAGNSMGGNISAVFSTLYPNRIKSLTLIDSAGVDGDTPSEFFKYLDKGENPLIANDEESFEYRMDFTMSKPPLLPWPLRPAFLRDTLAREDINKKIFKDMRTSQIALTAAGFEQKLTESVANNNIPTLIMWGEEDRVLDVSAAAAFKQLIPQAQVTIFPEVGHLPMVEIPSESSEVYQEFLSTIK